MIDLRSRALIGGGLLLAFLTGLLLYGTLSADATTRTSAGERRDVVVARVPIAPNTVVAPDQVERRSYPAELVPAGALVEAQLVVGQRVTAAVPQGVPIVRGFLAGAAGQSAGALAPAPGQVLVTFPTNDALTASGLVQVGDRVDVLATVAGGADGRTTQKTVQNIEVLAVAGRDQTRALVFSVDHQTALVLKYLRDSGAVIDIALRARADTDTVRTQAVDLIYLTQSFGIRR